MRVGVDARHLGSGRGVARLLEALLGALAAGFPGDEWAALVPGRAPVDAPPGVRLVRTAVPGRALFASAALTGRPALDALLGDPEVLWIPAPAPVAPGRTPYVLTVHDRSFEARPGDFTGYERLWHRLARPRALAAGAARVAAVSAATRDDLLGAGWPLDPARVAVVPGAPGLPEGPPGARAPVDGPYVLAVGALEPRKGLEVLAAAARIAAARGMRERVVLAGSGRLAGRLAAEGLTVLPGLDDAALDALLRGATALVQPSFLEGFGLPPLEAAARGVPSVVSDLPVFAETLGDAALRVAPGDADALARALLRITGDPALREALGSRARAAAGRYTWDGAARTLRALLADAAGERP